nr:MAG TPA: hypothetical protein [Caudoviricetes sp.]
MSGLFILTLSSNLHDGVTANKVIEERTDPNEKPLVHFIGG